MHVLRAAVYAAITVAVAGTAMAQDKVVLRYAHVGTEKESQTRYAAELA